MEAGRKTDLDLHRIVGIRGAYEILRELHASSVTQRPTQEIIARVRQFGYETPESTIRDLISAGLLREYGDRLAITTAGIRIFWLAEGMNGADLKEVFRRLGQVDASLRTYELVREGMTHLFLQNLNDRPGFARLFLCSPWINLDLRQRRMLAHAIFQAERRQGIRPELLVITRPDNLDNRRAPDTVRPLQDLGASVYIHDRLHTKLYIREPDISGGYAMAILGSQNLTKSNYLELGIRINSDGQIIDKLIAYFWELSHYSQEI